MNADHFIDAESIYESEFKQIISFLIDCYEHMLTAHKNNKIENNENKIRNRLFKDYLTSNKIRNSAKLFPCRFECESAEIDDNYDEVGYTDIKILTQASLNISDAYFIIECKRIDGKTTLNRKYISDGIMRFIDVKKYPAYYYLNGMLGFIVDEIDVNKNIGKINALLRGQFTDASTIDYLKPLKDHVYISTHLTKNKKKLKLYHIMFDLSEIV
ncbi:MAG: hypothetical protein JST70_01955 [Bacteroidetes bacterium]|nr:hypothetical protein [Bacteroidota bacterium]